MTILIDTLYSTLYNTIMRTAYLSLGSNLEDRETHLRSAIALLQSEAIRVVTVSGIYETSPVGETAKPVPDYLNIVAQVETSLTPFELLHATQAAELAEGRTPTYYWGPRVIDIDILLFERESVETETLSIPHPRIRQRAFALLPLLEIDPNALLPDGSRLSELTCAFVESDQKLLRIGDW